MRNLRDQKGFSLIELMIVVVIIGILAAIAIPRFSNIADRARQAEAEPILRQIHSMQEMHFTDNGTYAATFAALQPYGLPANPDLNHFTLVAPALTADGAEWCVVATADAALPNLEDRAVTETGRIAGTCAASRA